MALEATANIDLASLLTGGNYPSQGGELLINDAVGDQSTQRAFYYDRLDFIASDWSRIGLPSTQQWVRVDPLFLDNTGTLFTAVDEPGSIGGQGNESVAVGEWDRVNNVQRVYAYRASNPSPNDFNEVNPLALNSVIQLDAFANVGPDGTKGAGPTAGNPGHLSAVDGYWLFFETWGFALCVCCDVVDSGGTNRSRVMGLLDLSTGAATIVDSPVAYGTQSHKFAEAQLFGQDVEFQFGQFVPDDISTPSAPRGRLVLSAAGGSNPGDSSLQRSWVKIVDWNPLAVEGTPSRVHLRERLLSAIDLDKGNPGALNGVHSSVNEIYRWMFHPRTNRLFLFSSDGVSDPLVAGEQKAMFISSAPVVSEVTEPSAQSDIVTGRITSFSTTALGTLEEKIGGVSLQATLQRESTVDEVLPVTPSAGETVALQQTVSPTDPNLSPITVKKDGVPLTEGVHYNLDRPNSEIDFIGPEPVGGSTYTATYRHFGDPAGPPHGTLLNQFAETDETGQGIFRVDYDEEDPVDDRWDRLDVVQV